MRIVILAAIAVFAGAMASAQVSEETPDPVERFALTWEERPSGSDFARYYPPGALNDARSGFVILCCRAQPDRRLDCPGGLEWPEGYGFGRAAAGISRSFKLDQAGYDRVGGEATFQIPIRFRLEGSRNNNVVDRQYDLVSAHAESFCANYLRQPFQVASAFSEPPVRDAERIWEVAPDARPQPRYSVAALNANASGAVLLCCSPEAGRSLSCAPAVESPQGLGFAELALAMSADYRMTETALAAMQTRGDPVAAVPFLFTTTEDAAATRLYDRLKQQGAALCRQAWEAE